MSHTSLLRPRPAVEAALERQLEQGDRLLATPIGSQAELGSVAARMAAAERAAGAGDLWTPSGSARAALREADEALSTLED